VIGGITMAVTELAKWGNSQGIRISKKILKSLDLDLDETEGKKIRFEVEVENGKIILCPIKEKTKLDKLFDNFDGDSKEYKEMIDWGEPVGKEM
jgi:antitoxin MazE